MSLIYEFVGRIVPYNKTRLALRLKAQWSFETSVTLYRLMCGTISENINVQEQCCEHLRCYMQKMTSFTYRNLLVNRSVTPYANHSAVCLRRVRQTSHASLRSQRKHLIFPI